MVRRRRKSPQEEESSQTDSVDTKQELIETKDQETKEKQEYETKRKQKNKKDLQSQQSKKVETTHINSVELIRSKLQGVVNDLKTFADDINQIVNLVNTIEQVEPLIQELNKVQSQSSEELDLETVLTKSNIDLSKLLNEVDNNKASSHVVDNSQYTNQQSKEPKSNDHSPDDSNFSELDESELSDLLAKMISQKLNND